MKIPNKLDMNHPTLKKDGWKKQSAELFNNLIDCIIELKKENSQLKNKR